MNNPVDVNLAVSAKYISDYAIYITIAFVYAFFFSNLINRIVKTGIDKKCEDDRFYSYVTLDGYQDKNKKLTDVEISMCDKMQKDSEDKKFIYLMIVGSLSVLLAGILVRKETNYEIAGMGIGLGGFLTIIYQLLKNWHRLSDDFKIGVLGILLTGLIYGSVILLKN